MALPQRGIHETLLTEAIERELERTLRCRGLSPTTADD